MFRRSGLILATALALLSSGCQSGDTKTKTEAGSKAKPKKAKRITRFKFSDVKSNRKTGGTLKEDKAQLVNEKGERVSLSSFRGKTVVLVFMRGFSGSICPYCTTYTAQIASRYSEFKKLGAEVLVVYPTRKADVKQVKTFVKVVNEILEEDGREEIPFPVFLDPGTKVVKEYNLLGDLSKPSTFVLDAKGAIRYVYVGRDTDDRPAIERVVAEVKALKGA